VRQHFQYAPLGMSVLLMGAFLAFLLTALRVLAVGTGRVGMIQAAESRGFVNELRQCSRSYWKPEAARINKV
ncbi:MAG TPA: hypothetical protein VF783_04390, partial [Terriglobales bacterium]